MNLLEKYYLQGKGKLMAGIFVLVVLLIISTIAFTGCFSSGKKSDDKNTVTVFNYGRYTKRHPRSASELPRPWPDLKKNQPALEP